MSITVRPEVAEFAGYQAGRKPADVARTGERVSESLVKLSSNELAMAPLPAVQQAVQTAMTEGNRYPDFYGLELVAALAEHHGVDESQVVVDNGSSALCLSVVSAVAGPGDRVVLPWRSFEVYSRAAAYRGAEAVRIPLADGLHHDLVAMAGAVDERTKVVFVCNPNNPTGAALDRDQLAAFIDRIPGDVLVVLDEAYQDFVTAENRRPIGVQHVKERDNVVVLRTFSKAFGLAGLRVGYAVGPSPVIDGLRRLAVPFAVSGPAQAAALAALGAEREVKARVAEVTEERGRVAGSLRQFGMDVSESDANFWWLPLGKASEAFARSCEASGVLVRPFAPDGVRVTVGTKAENDRFLDAVQHWLDDIQAADDPAVAGVHR